MGTQWEVKQSRHKTNYDYRTHQPTFNQRERFLIFSPALKKGKATNFMSLYGGAFMIVEIMKDFIFRVCNMNKETIVMGLYDRKKENKTREKILEGIVKNTEPRLVEPSASIAKTDDNSIETKSNKLKIEVHLSFWGTESETCCVSRIPSWSEGSPDYWKKRKEMNNRRAVRR